MRDRTLGIILTILVVFLIGIPGITCMGIGLTLYLVELGVPLNLTQGGSTAYNITGFSGLCIGFFLLLITILISYLLLHRKPETTAVIPTAPATALTPATPAPPVSTDQPAPPPSSDEPLPPTT
jgi:hypothetical protein